MIGRSLRAKGFVTPFDDAMFSLELDLLNLENLRVRSSSLIQSLPSQCHRGVDFLLGLGQTISVLSADAKTRLLGRLRSGLKEGLWPLEHELRIAANLSKRGWNIFFHDLEEGSGYDFLVTKNGTIFEVEAKAISAFTGWPVKPENLNKLLVEVKQHFEWKDGLKIPLIGLRLSSALLPERTQLCQLVAAISEVALTKKELSLADAHIRYIGTVPDMGSDKLMQSSYLHSRMARKIVLVNPTSPKLVLEIDSDRPVQLDRKIAKTISEAARKQFSRRNPGVIWTHINFIPKDAFSILSTTQNGKICFLDRIAEAALLSEKRCHLAQIVFSGGSVLHKTASTACSSYGSTVYDSPACCFGRNFLFPGGRRKRLPANVIA